jgi:hypothetical protein
MNNRTSQKSNHQFKIAGLRSERMLPSEQHGCRRDRVKSRAEVDIVRRPMGRMEKLVVKRVSIVAPDYLRVLTN